MQEGTVHWGGIITQASHFKRVTLISKLQNSCYWFGGYLGDGAFSSLLIQFIHGKNISNLAAQKKEARANARLFETHGNASWSQTSWSAQG